MTAASAAHWSPTRSILASVRLSMLQFVADPQWLIPSMIAPVIFALASYFLLYSPGTDFAIYAILGAGMMSMWGQTLYGSGWATGQDRMFGTLEPTLQAPTPYLYVVVGRVVWNVVSGLVGGLIVYLVILSLSGAPPALTDPFAAAVLFVFVMITLASLGTLFAAMYVYTRYAGFIQNIGEFAFYIGTGCMVPVVFLPLLGWPVALLFPPTWALDALRTLSIPGYAASGYGFPWGPWVDILGALATTAVYLAIAGLVFRRVEQQVLEHGDLNEY